MLSTRITAKTFHASLRGKSTKFEVTTIKTNERLVDTLAFCIPERRQIPYYA